MYHHAKTFGEGLPDDYVATPHKLCRHCRSLCNKSQLLRQVPLRFTKAWGAPEEDSSGLDSEDVTEEHVHATMAELEQSYVDGCHLCSQIYHRLTTDAVERLREPSGPGQSVRRLGVSVIARESTRSCRLQLSGRAMGPSIPILAENDGRLPPVGNPFPAQLSLSTGSQASMALAREWIRKCRSSHSERCRPIPESGDEEWNPTRLIDVGCPDKGINPRIYHSSESREPLRYLTLSHRWGKQNVVKLTSDNMDSLAHHLPLQELSQTFKDAIKIASQLGYQYIWIDSLCIIQDSAADWEREAVLMAKVYGLSDCTLAALSMRDSRGCFRRRNPLFRRPCRLVKARGMDIYAYGFTISGPPGYGLYEGDDDDRPDFVLDNNALLRRAWVFQERLLSHRILYLGASGLYWECCEDKASEFWPGGNRHEIQQEDYRDHHNIPVKIALAKLADSRQWDRQRWTDNPPNMAFSKLWNEMVDTYTSARLTYESDRAVALSGVATMLQVRTGMTYLAGLWKEFLPDGLTWRCSRSKTLTQDQRRRPTWSWLSVEGAPVSTGGIRAGPNVSNVKVLYTSRAIAVIPNSSSDSEVPLGKLPLGSYIQVDGPMKRMEGPLRAKDPPHELFERARDPERNLDFSYSSDVVLTAEDALYFLLIRSAEYNVSHQPTFPGRPPRETEIEEQGLVLVHDSVTGGYIRLGQFANIHQVSWETRGEATGAQGRLFLRTDQETTVNIY